MDRLDKEQWGRIISIVLLAVAAIFSVLGFGVDLGIINFEPEARAVRERIAIDSRFDSYLYNGADLYVYSDDHVTSKFFVDGATGNTTVAGTLTGSGTFTTTAVAATGASTFVTTTFSGPVTVGVDGTSYDVKLYSDTAGDYLLWDQANEALTIIGTNGQDALNVDDGNVDIADALDVDGAVTFNSTLDVDGNISSGTGGVSITDALIVGVDGTSYDVTLYSDTAGDYLLWDQANEALTIIGTNGQDALNVDDGNVDIDDDLDVNGTTYLDELTVDGASDFNAAMNVDANGDFDSLSTLAIDSDSFWDSTGSVQINDNAVITGTLTVSGTSDLVGAVSSSTGAVTVTDSLYVTDTGTFTGLLLSGFANETITDGEWLTATVMAYALDSGGNVTMTLGAVGTEGQTLILIGDDANTITIADTNIRTSDGNAITLGQYDVAMFVYQDSEWIELLKIANQ